jgi:PST family polysaccharide transporter
MPSFIFKLKKIKPLLRFSSEYSFVSIVNYSVQKSDEVLLGKFGDVSSLGLYSTAFKLVLMPMGLLKNQIVSVLFPAFSSIQNDKGRLKNAVFSVLSYLSLISIPAICIIWLLAPEAVSILLTAEWSGIDVYIRFLALALSFEMVQFPGAILLAQGLSGKYAKLMISYRGIYFFFMFAGVLNFGTTGLLWGIVLAGALSFLPMIWYTGRSLGISVREYLSKIVGPLLISLPALLFGFYVSKYICHSSLPMMGLFIKSTAFGSCFLILLFLFGKNMREQYLEILNKFNLISSKNKL